MGQRVKIGQADELAPGQSKAVEVEGRRVAVFNVQGSFYAVDDCCPHADAPLVNGFVDEKQLSIGCPFHGADFDLKTGKVLCPPAREDIRAYPVIVEGEYLILEM